MSEMNRGLILEPIQPYIGFLDGVGGELPDILPSGDWEPYLPVFEKQSKYGLETMNCVQFSRLNVCEIQAIFHGKPINKADRFMSWATGCTKNGNTFSGSDFGFRLRGCCDEQVWPWNEPLTWEQYNVQPPDDVIDAALKLHEEWNIGMLVWVPTTIEGMKKALKKGPLWVCNQGHAFVIYKIDDRIRVFDTYGDVEGGKGSFPLNYPDLYAAFLAPFNPRVLPPPTMQLPNNSLIIVVDTGERLMNADGTKLFKDDAGKILLEVTARNASPSGISQPYPIVHVKAADVASLQRVNLKGEPA